MPPVTFICPRCLLAAAADAGFCPRCGLPEVRRAAADTRPIELAAGGRAWHILDRIAIGSISSVYRCVASHVTNQAIFKVARHPCTNHLLVNEAAALGRLIDADSTGRFTPFLPEVEIPIALGDGSEARQGAILRMDDRIQSPDELFTLHDLRAAHPAGLDPRHVAWIWRRLLTILGFAHLNDIVHAAVLPEHVLVEPREHKLLLIDWCCAAIHWQHSTTPVFLTAGYRDWYARENALRQQPTPGLDVALAARCMIELLGGDPVSADMPPAVPAGLQRHFQRCLARRNAGAWKLLDDFDRLIQALWGPRTFVQLHMPPKRPVNQPLSPN